MFGDYGQAIAEALGESPREASAAEAAAGAALLDAAEQERLVALWADRYPARWSRICAEVSDPALVERALVTSAVRAAIMDRRPCPRGVLEGFEGGQLERSPAAVVTLALDA